MQNYLEALGIKTKDSLKKELDKTKSVVKDLEGLGLQDFDVYKSNKSKLNEIENIYNSFGDISKASEKETKDIISKANSFLSNFVAETRARDEEIQKGITNVATNTVAAMAGPATRAGISTASAAIPAQQVMSQAQQQRAQQASLTDQKIQEAAMQFLNMEANMRNANIANQINIRDKMAKETVAAKPKTTAIPKPKTTTTTTTPQINTAPISTTDTTTGFPKVAENDPDQTTALTWLSNQQKAGVAINEAYLKGLISSSKSLGDTGMANAYTNILNLLKQQGQL